MPTVWSRTSGRQTLWAFLLLLAGGASAVPETSSSPGRELDWSRALLVGCTRYPSLEPERWLQGGANDVGSLERLLAREPFALPRGAIRSLSGWPEDETRRPTRANILQALKSLGETGRPGEAVLIYLSGHGSQQPDRDGDEIDGFDEVFLPADAGKWDGGRGVIENAISDDEIRVHLEKLRSRGVFVWLVVDACNSGTFSRGGPLERERRIPAPALIPPSALDQEPLRRGRGAPAEETPYGIGEGGGLVAMYAAQPHEVTYENPVPRRGGVYHGIFTHALVEEIARGGEGLTFRRLSEQVTNRHRANGRSHPTPVIEGGGQDLPIFGGLRGPATRPILLARRGGTLEIDAGRVRGLGVGSVLSVAAAGPSSAKSSGGFVAITEVGPLASRVEPVAFDGRPAVAAESLTAGSVCEVVLARPPIDRLVLGVDAGGDVTLRRQLEDLLHRAEGSSRGLWAPTPDVAEADWLVRRDGESLVLVPASGLAETAPIPLNGVAGSDRVDEPAAALAAAIARIARASRLLTLAVDHEAGTGPRVELELLRFAPDRTDPPAGPELEVPVTPGAAGRVLYRGDRIAFRIVNRDRRAVDVTLLFVDGAWGIEAVFPTLDGREYNRLKPGESVLSPRWDVDDETVGSEQVVAIAVRATSGPTHDFSYLQQPRLELRRGRTGRSPLAELLDRTLYGGTVRGLERRDVGAHSIAMLQWRTLAMARPPAGAIAQSPAGGRSATRSR